MPLFKTPKGHEFDTGATLRHFQGVFLRNPNSFNWQQVVVAMMAHQQATFWGRTELIIDVTGLTDEEVAAFYDVNIHI